MQVLSKGSQYFSLNLKKIFIVSCVAQNSQTNRICSDVIYLHIIKCVTCQFYLPVSKFRLYHHKHFSNVTWPDYLKSTAYLLNKNSAFVIMLKRQISSCNIRLLLFCTITIWYINKIAYGNGMSARAVAYHTSPINQIVDTYTASVSVRIHFVCNRKLRHSHSIASRKGPHTRQQFSEYRPVSALP
jgi:hypothetical protein